MMAEAPVDVEDEDTGGGVNLNALNAAGSRRRSSLQQIQQPEKPQQQQQQQQRYTVGLDVFSWCDNDDSWLKANAMRTIRHHARQGQLGNLPSRALCWRLLLGVLPQNSPPSSWAVLMQAKREQYQQLKARLIPDISNLASSSPSSSSGSGGVLGADPLSAALVDDVSCSGRRSAGGGGGGGSDSGNATANPWQRFYENHETMDLIRKDLQRLYPPDCGDYFMHPRLQQLLQNVLFVWSALNPDVSYRQGMHEVLAPIVLVLEKEAMEANRGGGSGGGGDGASGSGSGGDKAYLQGVLIRDKDSPVLEGDVFGLFEKIMCSVGSFYEHQQATRDDSEEARSTVQAVCHRMQNGLLKEADGELYRHLTKEGVTPLLYGMRWCRLVFVREYNILSLLMVWDLLFANIPPNPTTDNGLNSGGNGGGAGGSSGISQQDRRTDGMLTGIEVIGTAMIIFLKDRLLHRDQNECLQLLMNYPKTADIRPIIGLCHRLWKTAIHRNITSTASTASPAFTVSSSSGGVAGVFMSSTSSSCSSSSSSSSTPGAFGITSNLSSASSSLTASTSSPQGRALRASSPSSCTAAGYASSVARGGGGSGGGGSGGARWGHVVRDEEDSLARASQVAEEMGRSLVSAAQNVAVWASDALKGQSSSSSSSRSGRHAGSNSRLEDYSTPLTPEAIITADLGRKLRRSVALLSDSLQQQPPTQSAMIKQACQDIESVAAMLLREVPLPQHLVDSAAVLRVSNTGDGSGGGYVRSSIPYSSSSSSGTGGRGRISTAGDFSTYSDR